MAAKAPTGRDVPPEIQAIVRRANERLQTAKDRLRAYLEPRTTYLDADGILAAVQQGEAAKRESDSAIARCTADPSNIDKACIDAARGRTADCYEPNFLPY